MHISEDARKILQNFANINKNIIINPGTELSTVSELMNIFAVATVPDDFPRQFGIYDLNRLLGALSLFDNPNVSFEESFLKVSDKDGRSFTYRYADEKSLVKVPPAASKLMELSPIATFRLDADQLARLFRAASIMGAKTMTIDASTTPFAVYASNDGQVNIFEEVPHDCVHNQTVKTVKLVFKLENLKMLAGAYTVGILERRGHLFAHFTHTQMKLQYVIAAESKLSQVEL